MIRVTHDASVSGREYTHTPWLPSGHNRRGKKKKK